MINHNRTYTLVLTTLALVAAFSFCLLIYLAGTSDSGSLDTLLPAWSFRWVAFLNLAYFVGIIITLCARHSNPETGRRITRIMNWALLPALPGGTLVGLYGLLKVDR